MKTTIIFLATILAGFLIYAWYPRIGFALACIGAISLAVVQFRKRKNDS
jgi:hypothetical protein